MLSSASFVTVTTRSEQFVVRGPDLADVGNHSQAQRFFVEGFRRGGTAHPSRIPETGIFRNGLLHSGRAVRK